jgi:hypothetical protein
MALRVALRRGGEGYSIRFTDRHPLKVRRGKAEKMG